MGRAPGGEPTAGLRARRRGHKVFAAAPLPAQRRTRRHPSAPKGPATGREKDFAAARLPPRHPAAHLPPAAGCRGRWRPLQGPPPRPAAISRGYPKHLPVAARLPPGIGAAACQSGRRPAAPGLRRATETSRGGGRHSPGAGPRRAGGGGGGGWRRRCSRRRRGPAPPKSTSSGVPTAS